MGANFRQPQADWGILSLCGRSPNGRLSLHRLTAVPLPLGEGGMRAATYRLTGENAIAYFTRPTQPFYIRVTRCVH